MSWVYPNCSSANMESDRNCTVCGKARPTDISSRDREVVESKIVFSEFDVMRESVRDFFHRLSRIGSRPKAPKRKAVEKTAAKDARPATKTIKKTKEAGPKSRLHPERPSISRSPGQSIILNLTLTR